VFLQPQDYVTFGLYGLSRVESQKCINTTFKDTDDLPTLLFNLSLSQQRCRSSSETGCNESPPVLCALQTFLTFHALRNVRTLLYFSMNAIVAISWVSTHINTNIAKVVLTCHVWFGMKKFSELHPHHYCSYGCRRTAFEQNIALSANIGEFLVRTVP
jgi:hypothetical protein